VPPEPRCQAPCFALLRPSGGFLVVYGGASQNVVAGPAPYGDRVGMTLKLGLDLGSLCVRWCGVVPCVRLTGRVCCACVCVANPNPK
jgi:hypothetical protein